MDEPLRDDVEPDTKNWTWVLERRCPQCGFDTREPQRDDIPSMIRDNATAWQVVLGNADVRVRPARGVWSPLEYACHVRDVFRVFDRRIELMLTTDEPQFPNWDQDATAVQERYAAQPPEQVARELVDAADVIASRVEGVVGDQWLRPGGRSDGARFTVESLVRYFVHDPIHHLYDVTGTQHPATTRQ